MPRYVTWPATYRPRPPHTRIRRHGMGVPPAAPGRRVPDCFETGYADCQQGLEQLRGLLSHVDPHMTIGQLVGRIVHEALDRHDPSRPPRRARTGNRPAAGDSKPAAAANDHGVPESGHAVTVQAAPLHAAATPAPAQTAQPTPISVPAPNRQAAPNRPAAAGRKPNGAATPTAKSRARAAPFRRPCDGRLATGRRLLQLRRSADRSPLHLAAHDRDGPHPAVCAGRRRRSREPQALMRSPR